MGLVRNAVAAFLLLSPFQLVSQQTDPTVIQELRASLLATGGSTPVSDVTISAQLEHIAGSVDEFGTGKLQATLAGDGRIEFDLPSGNLVELRSSAASTAPGQSGKWLGPDGKAHAIAGHNALTDAAWFCPALTLTKLLSDSAYEIKYLGQSSRDGVFLLHFAAVRSPSGLTDLPLLQFQQLSRIDLYLDSTSLHPLGLTFNTHPDSDASVDIPVEIRFSDYRSIGGFQTPFHVERFINGGLDLDLKLQTADFNTGLTAAELSLESERK